MTFSNPILPYHKDRGGDPWFILHNGWYYYIHVTAGLYDKEIYLNRSRTITDMANSEQILIWRAPKSGPYSSEIWAPELHFMQNKWYVYFAASDGVTANHRMFVLERNSENPFGPYHFKGKISDTTDKYAIDGTILEQDGAVYFVWSGMDDSVEQQNLYIAPMKNPWTLEGKRICISKPTYDWEKRGPHPVNEGPAILQKNGIIFVVYAASHSMTDFYCLGLLVNKTGNVLDPTAWEKISKPVFSPTETVFGPGHPSFTTSIDGAEQWMLFHSSRASGAVWERQIHAQKFSWNTNGIPTFGTPITPGKELTLPSGEYEVLYGPKISWGQYVRDYIQSFSQWFLSFDRPRLARQDTVIPPQKKKKY